jgi:hypothetical protein
VFWREPGQREWRRKPLDVAGQLRLPEVDTILDFDDIHNGIEFD